MELADAIDRVKTAKGDLTLIAVGGGSILIPDELPGVSEVIRPDHFDAANAIGAAIASVSGQIDRIFHFGPGGRKAALDEASAEARDHAVAAGADPETVQIVELEEIPLAYLTSPAVRIRAKAAGALGGLSADAHANARATELGGSHTDAQAATRRADRRAPGRVSKRNSLSSRTAAFEVGNENEQSLGSGLHCLRDSPLRCRWRHAAAAVTVPAPSRRRPACSPTTPIPR